MRALLHCVMAAALGIAACSGSTAPPSGAGIALTLDATGLEPGTQMRWSADLVDNFGDLVDALVLDARAGRDGKARVTWRARCVPQVTRVTLRLTLEGLYGADGTALAAGRFVDPTPEGPFVLESRCPAAGDAPLALTVAFARPLAASFFDQAIAFDQVACAALLTCADMPSPALASLGEALSDGDPGAVLDLTCAGPGGAVPGALYLDDLVLSCGAADPSPATVDAGASGLLSPGAGLRDAENHLLAASVSREVLGSLGIARWWITVGLDSSTIATDCTLRAHASASAAPFPDGVKTPVGAAWPVFTWDVQITSSVAGRICSNHAADVPGSGIGVEMSDPATQRAFHHAWSVASGTLVSRCDPADCDDHASCLDGRCQCDVGWAGDGDRCDPVGVFVTRSRYDSGLGGLAGADAVCADIAAGLGFPGTWQAILSDSARSASARLNISGPIRNNEGELVAVDKADLFDGTLTHAVRFDQTGLPVVLGDVWTGTDDDGSRDGTPDASDPNAFCADWTCPDRYQRVNLVFTGLGCDKSSWPDTAATCTGGAIPALSAVTVTVKNGAGQTLYLGTVRAQDAIALAPASLSTDFGCWVELTVTSAAGAELQRVGFATGYGATFDAGNALGAFRVDQAVTQADRRTGAEAGTSDATAGWLARWGTAPGRLDCDGRAHLFCVATQ